MCKIVIFKYLNFRAKNRKKYFQSSANSELSSWSTFETLQGYGSYLKVKFELMWISPPIDPSCKGRLSRQRHFDRINLGWKEEGGKSRRIGFRITFSDKATPYSTSTKFKSRYPFLYIIAVVDRNSSQKLSYSALCLKITNKSHFETFRAGPSETN